MSSPILEPFVEHTDETPPSPRPIRRRGLWQQCAPYLLQGWGLLAIGTLFLIAVVAIQLAGRSHLFPDTAIDLDLAEGNGQVTALTTIQKSRKENDDRYRVDFRFETASGEALTGMSYTRGPRPAVGDNVKVEYAASNPSLSRIAGSKAALKNPGLFVAPLLFILPGLYIVIRGQRRLTRKRFLLKHGEPVLGKILSVHKVRDLRTGGRRPWQILYAYQSKDGKEHTHSIYLWDSRIRKLRYALPNGAPCVVLIHEAYPFDSVPLQHDDLPTEVADGAIILPRPASSA